MIPFLRHGDLVYFKKISFPQIKINDIIVFRQKKRIVCHRVIYKSSRFLITKGDNSASSDGKIFPRQILGKVYQVKRGRDFFKIETFYLLQSTYYFNEIVKIKKEFEKEKINYVFLKGLPLYLYFENKHPHRFYADCDVLIDKKDFQKAEKILFKFGYRKADTAFSPFQRKLKKKEIENSYFKSINGLSVVFDLHLEVVFLMIQLGTLEYLFPQKLINELTENFLTKKRQIKIYNEKFWILDFKFLVLYLALHIFHHNFKGAFRYEFLNQVAKKVIKCTQSWHELEDLIAKFKLENFVYPVFYLFKKYYPKSSFSSFLVKIPKEKIPLFSSWKNLNIFDEESRIKAGIIRFRNLFFLSSFPWWRKIWVFFQPLVIYFLFFVFKQKIFEFFPKNKKPRF